MENQVIEYIRELVRQGVIEGTDITVFGVPVEESQTTMVTAYGGVTLDALDELRPEYEALRKRLENTPDKRSSIPLFHIVNPHPEKASENYFRTNERYFIDYGMVTDPAYVNDVLLSFNRAAFHANWLGYDEWNVPITVYDEDNRIVYQNKTNGDRVPLYANDHVAWSPTMSAEDVYAYYERDIADMKRILGID